MLQALLQPTPLPGADLVLSQAAKTYIYGPLGIYAGIMTIFVVVLYFHNRALVKRNEEILERHVAKSESGNQKLYELAERLRTLTESLLKRIR